MADPISAGIVGSAILPTAAAASIPTLAGAGALAAPFAAAPALGVVPEFASLAMSGNPLVSAMGQGQVAASGMGGSSLFGFEPTLGGIGQGITQAFKAPLFGQSGTLSNVGQAAGAYNQVNQLLGNQQQQMQMAPQGQISRNQIQPMDYMSLLNPQQQTVLRPQPISLL